MSFNPTHEVGGVEECTKKADMHEAGAGFFEKRARNSLCGQGSSTESFLHILMIGIHTTFYHLNRMAPVVLRYKWLARRV